MSRPVIGIHDPSKGLSGPSRYANAILSGLDPAEFELVVFGNPDGPYRGRDELRLIASTPAPPASFHPPVLEKPGPTTLHDQIKRFAPRVAFLSAGMVRESRRLSAIYRAHPVDLLHTQNTGCEEAPIAARMARIPKILGTFHVDSSYDLKLERNGIAHRSLEVISNRCLHRAIAVSNATGEDWIRRTGISRSRVVTIPNGVDENAFIRRTSPAEARARFLLPPDRMYVGGVGRLEPAKGFGTLIEAVSILAPEFPDLSLVLAGDGPLRQQLEEQARALGVTERVFFLGFQREVREVYEALDIFCLPSLCEAMPYALLEAMAMCLPTVASAVGGVPEAIDDGTTGFVVPPRDPKALANVLSELLNNEHLRARMGQAGRRRVVDHFNQAESVRRTIDLYRTMLREIGENGRSRSTASLRASL